MAKCCLGLAFIQLLGIKFISSTLLKSICFVSISQEINVTENCFIWLIQMTWVFFFGNIFKISLPNKLLQTESKVSLFWNLFPTYALFVFEFVLWTNLVLIILIYFKIPCSFTKAAQSLSDHGQIMIEKKHFFTSQRTKWRSIRSLPWSLIEGCVSFCHSIGSEFGLQRFDFSSNWNRVDNHFLWCNGVFWLKAFWMNRLEWDLRILEK